MNFKRGDNILRCLCENNTSLYLRPSPMVSKSEPRKYSNCCSLSPITPTPLVRICDPCSRTPCPPSVNYCSKPKCMPAPSCQPCDSCARSKCPPPCDPCARPKCLPLLCPPCNPCAKPKYCSPPPLCNPCAKPKCCPPLSYDPCTRSKVIQPSGCDPCSPRPKIPVPLPMPTCVPKPDPCCPVRKSCPAKEEYICAKPRCPPSPCSPLPCPPKIDCYPRRTPVKLGDPCIGCPDKVFCCSKNTTCDDFDLTAYGKDFSLTEGRKVSIADNVRFFFYKYYYY